MKKIVFWISALFLYSGLYAGDSLIRARPFIVVLGIAQDAGYPQAGCEKTCCRKAWNNPRIRRMVASLALVDPSVKKWWLFDATPDLKEQLQLFQQLTHKAFSYLPQGIFLTHGHIGHYTGLALLGREAMNASSVPVYVLPRMKNYLTGNGPWSLLVRLKNITLEEMQPGTAVAISPGLSVTPFLVPHRDEFTETAGYSIHRENNSAIFIPDIDKWERWDQNIDSLIRQSSLAFLDATFFRAGELPGRSMTEIPHPLVTESMERFGKLAPADRKKIYFLHFNHTNPLLNPGSPEYRQTSAGYQVASQGAVIHL